LRRRLEAIAWWAGLRFDDLLRAYPPMSQAKWARVESSVNLDASGNSDPYFMSLDLAPARHPQSLLATHFVRIEFSRLFPDTGQLKLIETASRCTEEIERR
jgi:hypothetical protein